MKVACGNIQYKVICQVMADMPVCELHDKGGNVKVIHQNRLFLVAPVEGDVTPLGREVDLSDEMSNQSTPAELTPMECEGESPADTAWGH